VSSPEHREIPEASAAMRAARIHEILRPVHHCCWFHSV